MQLTAIDLAWMKGEASFVKGERLIDGARKAEAEGYRPLSEAYIAFLGGFSNMLKDDAHVD